jgi:predicted transcriptional regulator
MSQTSDFIWSLVARHTMDVNSQPRVIGHMYRAFLRLTVAETTVRAERAEPNPNCCHNVINDNYRVLLTCKDSFSKGSLLYDYNFVAASFQRSFANE